MWSTLKLLRLLWMEIILVFVLVFILQITSSIVQNFSFLLRNTIIDSSNFYTNYTNRTLNMVFPYYIYEYEWDTVSDGQHLRLVNNKKDVMSINNIINYDDSSSFNINYFFVPLKIMIEKDNFILRIKYDQKFLRISGIIAVDGVFFKAIMIETEKKMLLGNIFMSLIYSLVVIFCYLAVYKRHINKTSMVQTTNSYLDAIRQVVHALKNNLSALSMQAEVMEFGNVNPEKVSEILNNINNNIQYNLNLLGQLIGTKKERKDFVKKYISELLEQFNNKDIISVEIINDFEVSDTTIDNKRNSPFVITDTVNLLVKNAERNTAQSIEVIANVDDSGRNYIDVIDNGLPMSEEQKKAPFLMGGTNGLRETRFFLDAKFAQNISLNRELKLIKSDYKSTVFRYYLTNASKTKKLS